MQERGAAIIKARKLSSALSAASSACDHIHDWVLGTPKVFSDILVFNVACFIIVSLFYDFCRELGCQWGCVLMDHTAYLPASCILSPSLVTRDSGLSCKVRVFIT